MNNITALVNYARGQGWAVELTTNHLKFINVHTGAFVIAPSTPSDWRSHQNTVAELRRKGLDVPHRSQKKKVRQPRTTGLSGAAETMGIDLTLVRFPHIEAIMGQWRDLTWFDTAHGEAPNPITEDQRIAVGVDADIVAGVLLAPGRVQDLGAGALAFSRKEVEAARPSPRNLFIHFCTHKYWYGTAYHAAGLQPTRTCTCGKSFTTIHALAEHVVFEQERERLEHEPGLDAGVIPWADPDQLEDLFSSPELVRIEELEAGLVAERDRRRQVEEELEALRGRLKVLLG